MVTEEQAECIYLFDIRQVPESDDIDSESSNVLAQLVSLGALFDDVERIRKYHQRDDRLRSALGELILRKHLRSRSESPVIIRRTNPVTTQPVKPHVVSTHLCEQFNISHDTDLVAVAIGHPSLSFGMDVMKVQVPSGRTQNEFFSLMRDVFTKKEWTYIASGDDAESLRRFFRLWTAKEAYLKCVGTGLYVEPNTIEVSIINQPRDQWTYRAIVTGISEEEFRILLFEDLVLDYTFAVCISSIHKCDTSWVTLLPGETQLEQQPSLVDVSFKFIHLDSI